MGTIFEYQGRYGAALSSKQEAVNILRDTGERGFWLAAILGSYGNELSQVGRFDEAQKSLDEALSVAREIHSDPMVSQTLNFQGNRFLFSGNVKSARPLYEQALQVATRAMDREQMLISKRNLSKVSIREGRHGEAANSLRRLTQESNGLGLKYLSLEASIDLADALIHSKDYLGAQRELEATLPKCEKMSLRMLQARAHYLLATAMRKKGQAADAARHFAQSSQILEEIGKESHSDDLRKREDLRPIFEASVQNAAKH